jgi:hypothetical protein
MSKVVWVAAPVVVGGLLIEAASGRREVGVGSLASAAGLLIVLGLLP